ncbi:hypothetical protein ACFXDJ_31195 [Streptomyces sp. NPDC059443]|uniref:hypothetical protein n=1 Tax=unclassified Streptomyces TaxID=2593676 RepID=UPI0036CB5CD9
MSGTRWARTALSRALRVPLTVLCVVLLCVFGTGRSGPSPASAEGPRSTSSAPSAPSAPAEPTESPADPAGEDPEVRLAARVTERAVPGVRGPQRPLFHVKHPAGSADPASHEPGAATTSAPTASLPPVRSVVLRC